jgi:hypothetical protein
VILPALFEDFEEWAMEVRRVAEAIGDGEVEGGVVAAAEEVGEVGGGEAEGLADVAHAPARRGWGGTYDGERARKSLD